MSDDEDQAAIVTLVQYLMIQEARASVRLDHGDHDQTITFDKSDYSLATDDEPES